MDNLILYNKLVALPEDMKAEVADFIDLLLNTEKKGAAVPKPKFDSPKGMFKFMMTLTGHGRL